MPVGEQLGQVKEAPKGKLVGEFVDQGNIKLEQAQSDPSNRASDEKLKQDVDTTANDTATCYNASVNQATNAVNSAKGAFTFTRNSGTTTAMNTQAQQLLSKALSCVAPVIFWLLFLATAVTARVVSDASRRVSPTVQEPLLSDELVALQEIARALNRNVELVTNNFSWLKLALYQSAVLFVIEILKIFTGAFTQFCVDFWRETIPRWNNLVHPTEAFMGQWVPYWNAVAELRAEVADLRVEVADLRAERKEETNTMFNGLEERLKVGKPCRRHNLTTHIWPDLEESVKEGAACASRRAAGFLSD